MEKDFDRWNRTKKKTDHGRVVPLFYEREVWWCICGINIGVEIDGKHEYFMRPAIVIRKFNKDMALVLPTTTKDKNDNRYYQKVSGEDGKTYTACLSQIRSISSKRLVRKIGTVREMDYRTLLDSTSKMIKFSV